MVHVGAPFSYDNGVEEDEKQEPTWTKMIKDAAKGNNRKVITGISRQGRITNFKPVAQ